MSRTARIRPPAPGHRAAETPPPAPALGGRLRRGAALAEAVVAAAVLAVGVLATAGLAAVATRDAGHARAADAALVLVRDRVAAWQGAPCAAGAGTHAEGALRERWRVEAADGLAVLADTVTWGSAGAPSRVGVVAVVGCAP
jgi:Tfp pilus assembly protein PilV